MSGGGDAVRYAASWLRRLWRAWRMLSSPRRLAASAALGLFVTLFLPWYSQTVVVSTSTHVAATRIVPRSMTAWQAFSWAEAFVLVVAIGVPVLLFRRAEGHTALSILDGWAISLAGGTTCFVILLRMFEKPGVSAHGEIALSSGIEWGIFLALLAAALLTYAGTRMRRSPEGETVVPVGGSAGGRPTTRGSNPGGRSGGPVNGANGDRARDRGASGDDDPPGPRAPRRRSSWRPGDRPEWSDPDPPPDPVGGERPEEPHEPRRRPEEKGDLPDQRRDRPVGWLTAPPEHSGGGAGPRPVPADPPDDDQLTIPFDDR